MELKNSKTKENLMTAFSGESQARNKYTFYAEKAKQEGYPEIQTLFETMALNESTHGKILFQLLHDGIKDTASNLMDAMEGEFTEWTDMYPSFAKTAREEGFEQIAEVFEKIAEIEKNHEYKFLQALTDLQKEKQHQKEMEQTVEQKPETVMAEGYKCMFCDAVFDSRIDTCPVCGAIGSFEFITYEKTI